MRNVVSHLPVDVNAVQVVVVAEVVVTKETVNDVDQCNDMSLLIRDGPALHLSPHLIKQELEKLILRMKTTGEAPNNQKLLAATLPLSSPLRWVAIHRINVL